MLLVAGLRALPVQDDSTTALLRDLAAALRPDAPPALFPPASTPVLPSASRAFAAMATLAPTDVVWRERQRARTGDTVTTIVDVLATRGRTGRLATWAVTSRADAGRPDRDALVSMTELGSLDGLRRLELARETAYAVHDFTFTAPALTVRMRKGTAFFADAGAGRTALVLRGDGALTFAPPVEAEQQQVRIFSGRPALTTTFSEAFIRVPPGGFDAAVASGALDARPATPDEADRAAAIVGDRAPRTFTLNLGDLTRDPWSFDPPTGSAVVEFRTGKYGWLTYTRTPGDAEDVALFDRAHRRQISLFASDESRTGTGAMRDPGYDVRHYDVDIRLDPLRAQLTGAAALTLRLTQPAGGLTLRLAEPLAVTSVSSPQFDRLLAMRVSGQDQLIVALPDDAPTDRDVRIDVMYAGRLDAQAVDREALVPGPQVDGPPRAPTTPRFLYSTRRAWYPQPPGTDYATATLRVTTPDAWSTVGSGRRYGGDARSALAPADGGTWRTLRFDADQPLRYLAFVIGRWNDAGSARAPRSGPNGQDVAIAIVATPPESRQAEALAGETARIIAFLASAIGAAPHPTFTLAVADDELPGGHSPAYFALLQQPRAASFPSWRDDPVAFEGVPEFILAHEIAHQWWGQAVGYATYHDQWLSEGLAQYFALRYVEATRGPDVAHDVVARMRRSVVNLEAEGPISLGYRLGHIRGASRVFRAVLYNKSALVLDMFRRMLGEAAFDEGLRAFYRGSRFRAATTGDLEDALEAASGRSLSREFDQWIRGSALPRIAVTWRARSDSLLAVHVEQANGPFALPVPLVVEDAGGRVRSIDVVVRDRVTDARVPLDGPVRRVRVDRDTTLARW